MEIIVVKILVSIGIVVILAELSKRVNPVLAGLLTGLPLGTGLSVYFIAYEQGIDFMLEGIPWGIAGLSAVVVFYLTYYISGKFSKKMGNIFSTFCTSFCGIFSFFLVSYLLQKLEISLTRAVILFLVVFIFNLRIINILYDGEGITAQKTKSTFGQLLLRGAIIAFIIVLITGAASIVGSEWAGILSSFPSALFALLLVLQYEGGIRYYPSVIYGFAYGISTLMVFYILCFFMLPLFGLNWAYLLIYLLCGLYLFWFNKVRRCLRKQHDHLKFFKLGSRG
ncbi:MAG: hypothetical protein ACOYBM_03700 [Dethiobacteria bacterium]|nr:hypothetical protein [Bacillota bacterium]